MGKKIVIDEELQHPSWSGDFPEVIRPLGLKFVDLDAINGWVRQLSFTRDRGLHYGSGFLFHIPGASHDVILTAAHNLIGPNGDLSTEIRVNSSRQSVPESDIRVSAAYKIKQTAETDFGAILMPRSSEGSGFGYSIRLAFEEHFKGELSVSGYRVPLGPQQSARPVTSTGPCVGCYKQQIEYRAETEQGISGSPVWMEYQGAPVAVAIHNHRPERKRGGSRGSRITPQLLREVFGWVGVGNYGIKLRAQGKKASPGPPRGLYLNFSENFPFARVRLGSGTAFDVLPAHATRDKELYALAMGEKWVMFNIARQEAGLKDEITDKCLFSKSNVKKKTMRITVEDNGRTYQLRMQGKRIKETGDEEDAESSEVSFVSYPDMSLELFTEFSFE